jgi:hypothetical protein
VESVHKDFVDLRIGNELIDVKASRKFEKPHDGTSAIPFDGKRDRPTDVTYVHVVFLDQQILACKDAEVLATWQWDDLPLALNSARMSKELTVKPTRPNSWDQVRKDLERWFRENTGGREIYCFYRGPANQVSWGNQEPDNSYPTHKRILKYHAQAFCQFRRVSSNQQDIEYIIAFPFSHLHMLPFGFLSGRVRRKGITSILDMKKIHDEMKEYVFPSINRVKSDFMKRFPELTRPL